MARSRRLLGGLVPRVDLRLSDGLHARLAAAAKAERRSLNAMAGLILERVLGEGEPWVVGVLSGGAAPAAAVQAARSVDAGLARAPAASPSPSPRTSPLGGSAPPVVSSPAPAGPSSFRPDPKPGRK